MLKSSSASIFELLCQMMFVKIFSCTQQKINSAAIQLFLLLNKNYYYKLKLSRIKSTSLCLPLNKVFGDGMLTDIKVIDRIEPSFFELPLHADSS
ncbi:hypothetical protein BpHYR1_020562 [Brachionus plicatilis]|uniref:Uncharacterized protein n=1 Tax=Brachionus plicatilis TaxID=10195 RepID=A0A3M7S8D0_BRAPC|nr:hypothetical protein BpHYR1_020562 [Brachionus plicatilis]